MQSVWVQGGRSEAILSLTRVHGVCGSEDVEDTCLTWYLQRFPGFNIHVVVVVHHHTLEPLSIFFLLTKAWNFIGNIGKFGFFFLYGILGPKGCGKTTSYSHHLSVSQSDTPATLQSPFLLLQSSRAYFSSLFSNLSSSLPREYLSVFWVWEGKIGGQVGVTASKSRIFVRDIGASIARQEMTWIQVEKFQEAQSRKTRQLLL